MDKEQLETNEKEELESNLNNEENINKSSPKIYIFFALLILILSPLFHLFTTKLLYNLVDNAPEFKTEQNSDEVNSETNNNEVNNNIVENN